MDSIRRVIRLITWFIVGVLIAAVPMFANASVTTDTHVDATQSATTASLWFIVSNPSVQIAAADATSACIAFGYASWGSAGCRNSPWTTNTPISYTLGYTYSCPSGQNWTLSGTSCDRPACVSPQVRSVTNGTCTAPPCPASGTAADSTWYSGSGSVVPSSLCVNNCTYSAGDFGVATSTLWTSKAGKSTGVACSTNTATSLPATDPRTDCVSKGMAYGTVNGTTVCVAASTSTANKTTVTTPSTGSPSTVTSTDSITCDASGTCTKTTTTNTTSGGSGPGGTGTGSTTTTGTTSTTEPKTSFCQDNPTSSICTTSAFSGACAAGAAPTCTGDAVQCAQAQYSFQQYCSSIDKTDALSVAGIAATGGNDPLAASLPTSDKASVIPVGTLNSTEIFAAGCPADPVITAFGHSYVLPMSTAGLCTLGEAMGKLNVMMAMFGALWMIAGSVRGS
jgi:hypothetical protein